MSFYNIHNVDEINKVICLQKNTTDFTGVITCSKYLESNKKMII